MQVITQSHTPVSTAEYRKAGEGACDVCDGLSEEPSESGVAKESNEECKSER